MWNFRPSALRDHLYRGSMRVEALLKLYEQDNANAAKEGVISVPARRKDTEIRTCQWNVHYFVPYDCSGESIHRPDQLAAAVMNTLLEAQADVIVLNEFGAGGAFTEGVAALGTKLLQDEGYTVHCAECCFPTAIATKLAVQQERLFSLDLDRAAVALRVQAPSGGGSLWVYATHLEANDSQSGAARSKEMKRLLQELNTLSNDDDDILVIGDFNQQREQDYAEEEWEAICANKFSRQSPQDDGVATQLAQAGFSCIWDAPSIETTCNWPNLESKPPATHWSGTIIDYTYYRGPTLVPSGIFVSPCGLSDHRLVVCDWGKFTQKGVEAPPRHRNRLFKVPWKKK